MTAHHAKHAYGNIKPVEEETSEEDVKKMLVKLGDENGEDAPDIEKDAEEKDK
ncbi:MAG: hypothetical protein LUD29_03985 [Clostridia bacterium]|nr:hypothetical protein [Clostridia bacterium]